MARFYITTAIAYTNAGPHIGHALEFIQADAVARYRRMMGDDVFFLSGTDEHGTKIMRSAKAAGREPQEFVDEVAAAFIDIQRKLSVETNDFIRTSDRVRHWPGAQKIWENIAKNGDLYKKSYEGYYCVGHEAFIKSSELIDGLCPLHKTKPELLKEENWFFRLSTYRDRVKELIESGRLNIVPERRKSEILNLLEDAEDVSFSRPAEQLSWGIPVPGDPSQTMYVWADALTNYISALGYGSDEKNMEFWPAQVHLVGKDILRFHAMIWPAMLLSAGLETPKAVYVHGFVNVDGQKMSKTIGNVVDPTELLKQWPSEVLRYFMLRELQSTDDSDFTLQNIHTRYNSDLANGLGNLVQRVSALISKLPEKIVYRANLSSTEPSLKEILDDSAFHHAFEQFRLHDAVASVWEKIALTNAYINEQEPWKQDEATKHRTLTIVAGMVGHLVWLLQPFMPATAQSIADRFGIPLDGHLPNGQAITIVERDGLFPRKE